jgi:hypothetical protein
MSSHSFCLILLCLTTHNDIVELEDMTVATFMVLLQKSKSAIFDACNPLKYRDTILDKSVKNWFLQQNHGSYRLRGVEVTLRGGIEERDRQIFLTGSGQRPDVQLVPLATDKIQWSRAAGAPKASEESEVRAYDELAARDLADGQQVTVTGPLKQTEAGYQLHVRLFRNAEKV